MLHLVIDSFNTVIMKDTNFFGALSLAIPTATQLCCVLIMNNQCLTTCSNPYIIEAEPFARAHWYNPLDKLAMCTSEAEPML